MLSLNVVVRFRFETGDGRTEYVHRLRLAPLPVTIGRAPRPSLARAFTSSNASLDKKVGFASWLGGRGLRVIASATLPDSVCRRVLKVSAEQLNWAYQRSMEAALHVGMIGHNVNVANVVAGAFIATGQDIACVHESSLAQLTMQAGPSVLHVSMTLPSLIVGTVGGGTHLPRQQELLELMGCAGNGGPTASRRSSPASPRARSRPGGRHRWPAPPPPTRGWAESPRDSVQRSGLTPQFFQPGLRRPGDDSLEVTAVTPRGRRTGDSLLSELTRPRARRLVGQPSPPG